ncbi:MAG: TIGR02453 family protein [Cyclobacterium sp.]|nr:TIGR02453 family protein [Cyclobacterium sp.]
MRPYLDFLTALAQNNHKDWMDSNKKWYLDTKERFLEDVAVLLKEMTELEPELSAFKPKDCVFRQNRDVRFSANKAPYKTNFGAYFSPGGKKSPGPGYYLQIQPGNSFLAGGIWMPEADTLKKIRKEIDYSGAELQRIENDPDFKKLFSQIEGEKLKTSPRDYDADHQFIEYLKLKSFTVSHQISDKAVESGAFITFALDGFQRMKPFNDYLRQAIEEVEDGSGVL